MPPKGMVRPEMLDDRQLDVELLESDDGNGYEDSHERFAGDEAGSHEQAPAVRCLDLLRLTAT